MSPASFFFAVLEFHESRGFVFEAQAEHIPLRFEGLDRGLEEHTFGCGFGSQGLVDDFRVHGQLHLPIYFARLQHPGPTFLEDRRHDELSNRKMLVFVAFEGDVALCVPGVVDNKSIFGDFANGEETNGSFVEAQPTDPGSLCLNLGRERTFLDGFALSLGLRDELHVLVFPRLLDLSIIFIESA